LARHDVQSIERFFFQKKKKIIEIEIKHKIKENNVQTKKNKQKLFNSKYLAHLPLLRTEKEMQWMTIASLWCVLMRLCSVLSWMGC
jgi:hypothetical protein